MVIKGTVHQEEIAILNKYVPTLVEQILPDLTPQHGESGRPQYPILTNRQGIHLFKKSTKH